MPYSCNNELDIESWENTFYIIFNDAYQSYLNSISPIIFMNTLLDKIITITGSKTGYIASVNIKDNKTYLSSEAYSSILPNFSEIILSPYITIEIDEKTICGQSYFNNEIIITNDAKNDSRYNEPFKKYTDFKTYITIPFYFTDKIFGIIGLANRKKYTEDMIPKFKILGNLIGILYNNYNKFKTTTTNSDSRFITFQVMEEILNTITDGIIVTSSDFIIQYTNQNTKDILKLLNNNNDNINGSNIIKLFPQLEYLSLSPRGIKFYKNKTIDYNITDNDNILSLEFTINSVICNQNVYNVILIKNNTEKIINNENIKKNQNNFIAFLSHELRNPLQSIYMSNVLINNYINKNNITFDKKIHNNLNIISKSSEDMKKIINDVIDLSKLEANELNIEPDIINIKDIISNLIKDYNEMAIKKGLTITSLIDEEVPQTLFTDECRLMQILSNILSNAIKYSNKGEIKINIQYNSNVNEINFNITDEGYGIKKEELPKLFTEFGQTSNSFKICEKNNSNGIGLFVSQKIALLLGGKIIVQSEPNNGSTFTLVHPIKLGRSSSFVTKKNIIKTIKAKILIIDDNIHNLMLLKMLLESLNTEYDFSLDIQSIEDASHAINLCKINYYDIIFMDINMPILDGCVLSKIIKTTIDENIIIIATTGNIMAKKENHLPEDDKFKYFNDIIIKPYDDTKIIYMLNKYC